MLPSLIVSQTESELEEFILEWLDANTKKGFVHIPIRIEEGLKEISIQQIRKDLGITKFSNSNRIYVSILPINKSSIAAQNALLKPLEELSHRVQFLLGTTELNNVVPTIVSRCQIIQNKASEISSSKEKYSLVLDLAVKGSLTFLADPTIEKLNSVTASEFFLEAAQYFAHKNIFHQSAVYARQALQLRAGVIQNNFQPQLSVEAYLIGIAQKPPIPVE